MTGPDLTLLSARVRAAREARAFTQAQLAAASGLPQSQVSRIESGRTSDPAFTAVAALAGALAISLDGLADPDPDRLARELA